MEYHILDTDLYKFTTSYAYMTLFPQAECTFKFIDRNRVKRTKVFLDRYKEALKKLSLAKNIDEYQYDWLCKKVPFIAPHYWEWLSSFHFDHSKVNAYLDSDGILNVEVTDKCYKATLYEIPCMYLVTEVANDHKEIDYVKCGLALDKKIELANEHGMPFAEFGTRRRFTQAIQEVVIWTLKSKAKTCVGTSNVYFACKYDMTPIGTHPHEWFMFHGAQYGYKQANYLALENWVNVYDGSLGIGLTDTYGTDNFFQNFSLKQAKLFDGIRQDSGSEDEFIAKALKFYEAKKINSKTKTVIFSNGLDFPKGVALYDKHKNTFNILCCFGTDLTNTVFDPMDGGMYIRENIVMKMSRCRMNENQPWYGCVKLSDDAGKHTGDGMDIQLCKRELGIL